MVHLGPSDEDHLVPGAVDQDEIEALYTRFCALDRGSKVFTVRRLLSSLVRACMHALSRLNWRVQGYVSSDELMNIPELSINPLARRLERLFDSINFKVQAR